MTCSTSFPLSSRGSEDLGTRLWHASAFCLYFLCFRESERVFGSQGLHLSSLLKYVGPFCLLWVIANYSYVRALGVLRAADVSALFSSCNAFVYVFSLIWLQERLGIVQVRGTKPRSQLETSKVMWLTVSIELIMWNSPRREILKLTFHSNEGVPFETVALELYESLIINSVDTTKFSSISDALPLSYRRLEIDWAP